MESAASARGLSVPDIESRLCDVSSALGLPRSSTQAERIARGVGLYRVLLFADALRRLDDALPLRLSACEREVFLGMCGAVLDLDPRA